MICAPEGRTIKPSIEMHSRRARPSGGNGAVVHKAVRQLRVSELGEAYEQAFTYWDEGEAAVWDAVAADGLDK
jgi:hypothetical protein